MTPTCSSLNLSSKVDFDRLFPDNREEGATPLRQCQLVMLRMLKVLDYLCTRHGIEYFLTGGTLLGAIRHGGFIPWDDDLDVGMTRANYEKFVRHAVPELPNDIFFQNEETDANYPYSEQVEARLRDKYSSYTRAKCGWHVGLQVDIFVYDKAFLPNNFCIILLNMILGTLHNKNRIWLLCWISNNFSSYLVYASSYMQNPGMWKYGTYVKEKELKALQRVKFEDIEVYVPVGWHSYLTRQYKNYMQLPPIEKRSGHHSATEMADPFTPCQHRQSLHWKDRSTSCTTKTV